MRRAPSPEQPGPSTGPHPTPAPYPQATGLFQGEPPGAQEWVDVFPLAAPSLSSCPSPGQEPAAASAAAARLGCGRPALPVRLLCAFPVYASARSSLPILSPAPTTAVACIRPGDLVRRSIGPDTETAARTRPPGPRTGADTDATPGSRSAAVAAQPRLRT